MAINIQPITNALQTVNEKTGELFALFEPQFRNIFEIILAPTDITAFAQGSAEMKVAGAIATTAAVVSDNIITKFHIRSVSIPFPTLEYETLNEKKAIKGINHPDSCTVSFIENDLGVVRTYLSSWRNQIAFRTMNGDYIFRNNQLFSKKNAIIIPQMATGLPSPAWIELQGMKFQSLGEVIIGHDETDPMILEATFALDSAWWLTGTSLPF